MFHNLSQCKRTDISTPCIVGIAHQNKKCKICSISEAGKKVKQCLVSKAVKEELEERVAVFDGGTSIFGIEKKDKISHGKVRQEHARAVIYQVQLPSNDKEQLKIDQPIGIQKLLNKPKQGNNKGQQRDSSTGLT